jgi:hypothetical protein
VCPFRLFSVGIGGATRTCFGVKGPRDAGTDLHLILQITQTKHHHPQSNNTPKNSKMGDVQHKSINSINFVYSSSGFQAFGYNFDDNPSYTVERPIEFWKAQLAFRGFSPRGNNIEALKQRVRDAGKNTMDKKITEWCEEMLAATRVEAAGNRKRKAEQELENSRQAASARAGAAAASASNAPIGRPAMLNFIGVAEQARQAAIAKDAYQAGRRVAPPPPPPRPGRIVNRRLAQDNPGAFLRACFFDEDGNDTSDEPVALPNLCPADRAHIHQAASSLRLFHETTVTSVMVLGSGKNRLGAYTPNFGPQTGDDEEEDGEEDAEDEEFEQDGEDGEDEEDEEDEAEEENDDEWDITGEWEIKCPIMAECFGQFSPYTLSIFTTLRRTGRETYGLFDFGAYKGVFRFSTQTKDVGHYMHQGYRNDIDEFVVDKDDLPSAENPTRCYRGRGKEDGEDVIQLDEDQHLYTMTFSDG